jgi:hypothetical protein
MARFYVSIADANRILDTSQECLSLEHAKKLALRQPKNWPETRSLPTSEESTFRSRMREAIWSTMSRYRMGCPSVLSSMECGSTGLEVGPPPSRRWRATPANGGLQTERMTANRARCRPSEAEFLLDYASLVCSSQESLHRASSRSRAQPTACLRPH